MARALRIEYAGAWYHVTCRGNERRAILSDDHDRGRFVEILAESMALHAIELHAYVLMENHFHVVIRTAEANLGRFMQRFNTAYTVYYNRRHQRRGHLYQGRYKAILIDADTYLLELSRYVHLNPVRVAGYSQRGVEEKRREMRTYRWSSYRGYVRLQHRQSFVQYSQILGMVGGRDDRERGRRYERFVMAGVEADRGMGFWEGIKGQAVLGTEAFVDWVRERFLSEMEVDRREVPGIKELEGSPMAVEAIARKVGDEFGVSPGDLYRRRAASGTARSVLMELCRIHLARRMGLSKIGQELGGVSGAALSHNSRRLAAKLERDQSLRSRFDRLSKALKGETQSLVKV